MYYSEREAFPDLVVFTGGADICPSLYGEERHPFTNFNKELDRKDIAVYQWAKENNIPCVGICRGGQFLNVMNGGKLHQHIENHGRINGHMIETIEGENSIIVTSTHHQMMIVAEGGKLLAWAEMVAFEGICEPEVVWYGEKKDLCIQYHPEYMMEDSRGYKYFQELLERYIYGI